MTRYIFIGLLLFTFTSCGEEFFSTPIEFDMDEFDAQISVVGRLVTIPVDTIGFNDIESVNNLGFFISRSKSVLDSLNFEVIENAKINVSGSDGTDIEYLFHEDSGYYFPLNVGTPEIARLMVEENAEYNLQVEVPGEEIVTASVSTSTFGKLESVEIELNDIRPDDRYTLDKLTLDINDPPGKHYYYLRTFYKTDRIGSDGEISEEQSQGYIYNFNSLLDGEASLFTDELFEGGSTSLEFYSERHIERTTNNEESVDPHTVFVNLWTLTEEEYNFRESIKRNKDARDNPFAEPTVVFSNIENGTGIFSLMGLQTLKIKL